MQAQFVQEWHSEMGLSRKCTLYRHVKTECKLEPYLLKLSRDVFRYIVKLRCSNHKLAIETGRYYGIDRNLRYCGMCNLDVLGDEYHVFFELGNLPVERAKDAVCFLQRCGVSLVSSYAVCFLQRDGVSLASSAIIYNTVKVKVTRRPVDPLTRRPVDPVCFLQRGGVSLLSYII